MFQLYYLFFLGVAFFVYGFWSRRRTIKLDDEAEKEQSRSTFRFIEVPLMGEEQFWRIIHGSKADSFAVRTKNLTRSLLHLSGNDIVAFHKRFRYYQNTLFTDELCAAASLFDSNAGFDAISSQVIATGRRAYDAVMNDPEAILDYLTYIECRTPFDYSAGRVYGDKTGDILQEAVWRDKEDVEPSTIEEFLESLRWMDQNSRTHPINTDDVQAKFPRIAKVVKLRSSN